MSCKVISNAYFRGRTENHHVGMKTKFPGSHDSGSGVIGEETTKSDDTVAALSDGICKQKLQLPNLQQQFHAARGSNQRPTNSYSPQ